MKPAYAIGDRVKAMVNHMPGMKGMTGEVAIVRTEPAYYGIRFDGEKATHKWLAEDELSASESKSMMADSQPEDGYTAQEKPSKKTRGFRSGKGLRMKIATDGTVHIRHMTDADFVAVLPAQPIALD